MRKLVCLIIAVSCGQAGCSAPRIEPWIATLVGRQAIPGLTIDGQPARIHTQGLYVAANHIYVTGRLETPSRRALLVRLERENLQHFEHVDLTPDLPPDERPQLDHPGGFDCDGDSLWIPVAESRRGGRSVILRYPLRPDALLADQKPEVAYQVDDHIGAVALDRWRHRVYGANWDTETVYVWTRNGELLERISMSDMLDNDPNWKLAVQDWKCVGPGQVLAGGIDKNPKRDPSQPVAVVEWLDLRRRRCLARVRLPARNGLSMPVTNEGLDVVGHDLYLLPGDLGDGAEMFHYRIINGPTFVRQPI